MTDKIVITAAITGGSTRKEQHPNVPYTTEEIVTEAKRCEAAGAAILHIHFRDPTTGQQTFDPAIIREVTSALRQETGAILNLSTGGMGSGINLDNRKNVLIYESPEMASLNPGTTNFCANAEDGSLAYDLTFENPFRATIEYGRLMQAQGIAPEFECFSTGHVHNVLFFQQHYDFLTAPLHFSFVFGILGAVRFDPMSLASFLHAIPPGSTWQGIGVGDTCFRVAMACAAFGGHTRVGLEDNIYIDPAARILAQGSWDQVERVVQIARLVGREPATPAEARAILHLA
jgi:uncharacterized protein (DUF849 family)